ncbi:MAG: glycosyltransferase family 4 protein [Candidatus Anstonellales archaeon]
MIKTCHISTVHPLFDTRIFYKECKTLAEAGYNVTLIVQHDKEETIEGIHVVPLPRPQNRFQRMSNLVRYAFKLAVEQDADIYHFHDPELIPIGLRLKKLGKKVIYDVHEDVPRQILSKYYIPQIIRPTIAKLFEFYENRASKHFDAIITATPFINERFIKLGCNAININNFPLLSEFAMDDIDWSKKERAVCYVGGLDEIRGLNQMIEAISKTDAKLILAGNFTTGEQKKRAMSLKGWQNVKYLGYADREKVKEIFLRSMGGLVVLLPESNYVNSNYPTKMLEYMSAGLPVISSDFPLWKEVIEGNKCGICVNPLNPEEIAEAIKYLVNNPEEAREMGKSGKRVVLEKYNWDKEKEKLLVLYRNILFR